MAPLRVPEPEMNASAMLGCKCGNIRIFPCRVGEAAGKSRDDYPSIGLPVYTGEQGEGLRVVRHELLHFTAISHSQ